MVRVAICDDEVAEREHLLALVKKWGKGDGLQAFLFASAEELLFAIADMAFDILLLDIQMGGMDGVASAKKIRVSNKEAQIVFVTGYMDYIADGYDVEALNYLIKPVPVEKLHAVLDRAVERLAMGEKAIFVSHGGENVRLPLNEIRYLEVFHNYVTIHAAEPHKIKKTLAALEPELDRRFFRAGRSYIVNLRFVRKSSKTEVHLTDGTTIPLSRGLYDALNRAIIEL